MPLSEPSWILAQKFPPGQFFPAHCAKNTLFRLNKFDCAKASRHILMLHSHKKCFISRTVLTYPRTTNTSLQQQHHDFVIIRWQIHRGTIIQLQRWWIQNTHHCQAQEAEFKAPLCCQWKPKDPLGCQGKEEEGKSQCSVICKEAATKKVSFVHDGWCWQEAFFIIQPRRITFGLQGIHESEQQHKAWHR